MSKPKSSTSFYTPETVSCNNETFKLLLSHEEINNRISELGAAIDEDYRDKKPILIGILNGAFIFLSDLMRHITIPCEVDFYKLSSYGDAKVSSGNVKQRKDIDADITGRHIIIVEDIVDTGLSANYIMNIVEQKNPASVEIVTLLKKPEALKYHVDVKYVGFEIPTLFVLGYGLDYAQEGRNLAQIYVLDEKAAKNS
ncbi:MAG: hypoxanthine phosphoribosyltransferase [Balneolales bacterium]|nr:hypoxanthine phosphoribosyltransferase [Balneolales bacterium]